MRVLHLAIADDWEAAVPFGEYQVSTRNTSVDDAGFLHASTASQLPKIARYLYADVTVPLVVLVIDLPSVEAAGIEVRWEPADLAADQPDAERFPRIYAALPTDDDTVVAVLPASFSGRTFVMPDLDGLDVVETPPG
ncbi:DUF952 domain-containing protein [Saxibacter everestensis]|uniref:DUF952 domain-containing protein n=1 Tax=Saxibacter everestensis TaxID=2909229 RepID=A0ABY8QNU1_9MICO|nr:DUF952 domain-containing protein [Brevibacteriaceae bacterium ZFBP1038]